MAVTNCSCGGPWRFCRRRTRLLDCVVDTVGVVGAVGAVGVGTDVGTDGVVDETAVS